MLPRLGDQRACRRAGRLGDPVAGELEPVLADDPLAHERRGRLGRIGGVDDLVAGLARRGDRLGRAQITTDLGVGGPGELRLADVEVLLRRRLDQRQLHVRRFDRTGEFERLEPRLGVTFAIDTAEVRLPLTHNDLSYLDLPSETELRNKDRTYPSVTLSAQNTTGTDHWQAHIIRTEGVVDEISRVVYAVAQIVDPYAVLGQSHQQELKIGTFVNAEIKGLPADNVVVLPRYVLRPDNTVLVANENNELEILPVTVVRAEPKEVYISDGIKGGTRVVITTLDAPVPGTKLAIRGLENTAEGTTGERSGQ